MNERIRLLAELADKAIRETDLREVNGGIHITPAFVKFAELIVKECAGKVDNILREKKDGGGTMGDEIREHFGVEP